MRTLTGSSAQGRRAAYPTDQPIHRLIERQAARQPDKPAVDAGSAILSFGELNRRANRLAAHLRALGAGPEVRIGTCFRRSPEAVVSVLAIVKSGAVPVLLDHALPTERIAFMLRDSGARAVVSTADLLGDLVVDGVPPVLLDRDRSVIDAHADTDVPGTELTSDSAAHVVYTSGSGGSPKGVVARHETVTQCVHWAREAFSVGPDDRATWMSAPGFGVSLVNELWPFLAAGCTVHLPDEETLLFPERLRDWLLDNEITVAQLVRTLAEPLWGIGWPADCALRLLLVTGERVDHWPPGSLPFDVAVTYGSTETTHITSWLDHRTDVRMSRSTTEPPPVGRPVANVSVHLLDQGALVQVGEAGEVHVAGPGLARGYLDDPGRTAAAWLPDPFTELPGARMYRTGDVGRLLADGSLEILGRVDRQVKIRGKRTNLDEVEAVLRRRTEVAEAAVVVHGDGDRRRLVAYLTGVDRDQVAGLHAGLAAELADHQRPADFVLLDTLPRTPNGKLDRQALPAPERRREMVAPARPARDAIEAELVDIWRELLGLAEVGVADDFFELGGHSLIAVLLATSVHERLGVRIDLVAFYERPTVGALAGMVARARRPSTLLVYPKPTPTARVRLVCFPFAGGGLSAFAGWHESLPPDVEVCCVQPPGRGERLGETPLERLDDLVEAVAAELVAEPHARTVFFGHSLGAVVAFELARLLRAQGHPSPALLLVSGSAAPQIPVTARAHELPDDELLDHVGELGGTPRELLDDHRLRQVVLPALRADFVMHETYRYRPDLPLDCPITAFGGAQDAEAALEEIAPWRTQTSGRFSRHVLRGGHFYLNSARQDLLDLIIGELAALRDPAEVTT